MAYLIFFSKKDIQNTIVIGSSLSYTDYKRYPGDPIKNTTNAYFQYVNDNDLLSGKKIEFLALNDNYEPDLTYENIQSLLKNDIVSFYGILGTSTIKRVLPIFQKNSILLFAPFSGATFLRDEKLNNVINFRASYKQEIENIINYVVDTKKLSKISIFYQNDEYGQDNYISLIQALKNKNLELHSAGIYKRNTLSISHAFNEILNSKPEAVLLVGTYQATSLFIKRAKSRKVFKDTLFCNISFSDENFVIRDLNSSNIDSSNIIFSKVVPNYQDKNLKIVQEYQEIMEKYAKNEELSFISFEVFLASKVLINAISNLHGNYSSKKLIQALKNPPKELLHEIKLEFKNQQLLNDTYLFEYKNGKLEEILQ